MANPSFADFDFAIADAIDPKGNLYRIQIKDDEYRKGRVEKRANKTSAGTTHEPFALPGGFATVYKFKTQSGHQVAFRVYRREVEADTQYRYEKIGPYFKANAPDITAEFQYFKDALKVGDGSNVGIFAVVIMTWVEGETLVQATDRLCQKRDRAGLIQLADQWAQLVRTMNAAKFAHGDLSGGNIMVRSDGRMVLVDYDGVFIPEFVGRNAVVGGTADYLHRESGKRSFDARMDDFSALVIYTALVSLAAKPELWDTSGVKYAKDRKPTTDHLLFQSSDLHNPDQSTVFKQLTALADPNAQAMVSELRKACKQPIAQVRLPALLVDPDLDKKQTLTKLEQAIGKGDDEAIAGTWIPILQTYPPAQKHRARAEQAIQLVAALDKFIKALATNDDEQIVQNYDPALDQSPKLTQTQRDRLADAKKRLAPYKEFIAALTSRDELALVKVYDTHPQILSTHPKITRQERDQVDLARQCIKMRDQVRAALYKQDEEAVAVAYNKILVRGWSFLLPEIQLIEQALMHAQVLREFIEALDKAEDGRVKQIYEQNQAWLKDHKALEKKLKRVDEAIQRENTLQLFRRAVYKGDDAEVVRTAALLPTGYARFTNDDRKALTITQTRILLRQEIQSGDDEKIATAAASYDKLAPAFYQLDAAEKQRILDARQNVLALQELNDALQKDDDNAIKNAYEAKRAFFDKSSLLTTAKKERIQLALERLKDLNALWEAIKRRDDKQIVALTAKPSLASYSKWMPLDAQQIERARAREKLRAALASDDDSQIYANYDAKILPQFEGLAQHEMDRVKRAVSLHADRDALVRAIQTDNDDVIAKLYKPELENFAGLKDEQKKRATLAQKRSELFRLLREAIDRANDEKIVELADQLPPNYPKLTAVELRRIGVARTTVTDLRAFREAVKQNEDEQIIARFIPSLQTYSGLTQAERSAPEQSRTRLENYATLVNAIANNDDDKIEKTARLIPGYRKITNEQQKRVDQAVARVQAALAFRRALAAFQAEIQDERDVAVAYDAILDAYSGLLPIERNLLKECRQVVAMSAQVRAALQTDQDEKIKAAFVAEQVRTWSGFTKTETDRIQLAQERLAALTRLRKALVAEDDDQIAEGYVDLLHNYPALIPAEQKRIELACQRAAILKALRQAIQGGDEREIVRAYDSIIEPSKSYTSAEREAVTLAKRVLQMPEKVRAAIRVDDERAIFAAYEAKLDRPFTDLSAMERERIRHAQAYVIFTDSLATNNDETISNSYDSILDASPKITEAQRNQFALAQKHWAAWLKFRQALNSGDEEKIYLAYDPILSKSSNMTPEVRTQFQRAVKCVEMRSEYQTAIATNDDRKIAAAFDSTLVRDFNRPTVEEEKRIDLAIQRVALLGQLEQAIADQNDPAILQAATPILKESINFTPELRRRVADAQTRDGALEEFLQAVNGNRDQEILDAYNPARLENYARVPQPARDRLSLARERRDAIAAFEIVVSRDQDQTILDTYQHNRALLEASADFNLTLRNRLELAQRRTNALLRLREAINSGDVWRVLRDYDANALNGYVALTQWDHSSLSRAKQVVEMYARLEQALVQDDHAAIAAAYDAQLLSRAKPLTELQHKRILLAQLFMETKRQVESELQQNSIARAIQTEKASQLFVRSPEFDAAKRAYITPLDVKNVTAKIHKQEIEIKWEWPSAPTVSHALVIWDTDQFIETPDAQSPNARIVERPDGQTQARVTFAIGAHWQYFVHIFSAIPVDKRGTYHEFVFAAGQESTSRAIARRPVRVEWRLTKRKGSPQNELELKTEDGTPLPQLVIVRQQHHLPMNKTDGAFVAQVPDAIVRASNPKQILVPLEVSKWARHTILRVFPADDSQADIILIVGGKQGLKIEVN